MPRSVECYAAGAEKGRPCKTPGAGITDQNRTGSFEPQPPTDKVRGKRPKNRDAIESPQDFFLYFPYKR